MIVSLDNWMLKSNFGLLHFIRLHEVLCVCVCALTLHQLGQEGDGLRQQHHVVLLQFGRQLHQHQ